MFYCTSLQVKEKECPTWDDVVTPINLSYENNPIKPTMHKRCNKLEEIKKKLFCVESDLNSLGEKDEKNKGDQEEKLMVLQKDYTEVETELRRFYEEELELVKAGEDPLMTCPHCFFLFSSYTSFMNHKGKCKHQLIEEEAPYVPHYRVLEGQDREQFLSSTERLSLHRKINLCVSTRTACKGIFPLLFPSRGNTSSGSILEELGIMGPEAYITLRRALLDRGELFLPQKLVLDFPEGGGQLYLPPTLLTPTATVKYGDITVEREDDWLRVSLPENADEESDDEDDDEDGGLTSDSSEDEADPEDDEDWEDEVFWGQEGGGPAGAQSGLPKASRGASKGTGGLGGGRGQQSSAGSQGRRTGGRSGVPSREDQQV